MIQGTMSNVGKSLLVAGLCRIFKQDGYNCAPFKSQNMALNSYVTKDRLEIGRAQAMQAQAAKINPDVSMNPILLKPTSDNGSQIILKGKIFGSMTASEYYKNKLNFIPHIMECYNNLCNKYDIVIIEGAGSPAELNLKKDDIVNMGMAKLAKSPVLLVGDIDRGGIFAQLIGTVNLLDKGERNYIKGLIVNKFRGNKSIFKSGIDILENKTNKPVFGVIPYIHCDIDDEDSLTERLKTKKNAGIINIAVIRLPRISNFTDFNAFEFVDEINLTYIDSPKDIFDYDMLIIPGTKNTIGDLLWLREKGFESKIKQFGESGKIVFGICGGFQMLGETINDADGCEYNGKVNGIGLLPIKTIFKKSKITKNVKGKFTNVKGILKNLNGVNFEGYEIHNGISSTINYDNICEILDDNNDAKNTCNGANADNIYGTYIHGIFDCKEVTKTIITAIAEQKGINSVNINVLDIKDYKEKQFDILADTIRNNIDMNMIYKILELSKEGI